MSAKRRLLVAGTLVGVMVGGRAHAGLYDIAFSDSNGDHGTLTLTTTAANGGAITAITGTVYDPAAAANEQVTGLLSLKGYADDDNQFFYPANAFYVTFAGFSFALADGIDMNISTNSPTDPTGYVLDRSDNDPKGTPEYALTMSVTDPPLAVPEPMSAALLLTGVAGLAAARRAARPAG